MRDNRPLQAAIADPDSFGTTLLAAAAAACGAELFSWDPATVALEIKDELGVDLPRGNANKLNAAVAVVVTDAFYADLPRFVEICNALWDGRSNPNVFDPADAAEIAWGATEALLLWPPDRSNAEPFSPEIVGYIGHVLAEEGLHRPPDVLRLGQLPAGQAWAKVVQGLDPETLAAADEIQGAKEADIDLLVRARLHALVVQLEALRLPGCEDAAEMLAKTLAAKSRE